jgi:hypothetical protein
MIDRRVVGAIAPADAEAHAVRHRVRDGGEGAMHFLGSPAERVERDVRADGRVATGDVEPDADHRHEIPIRGDTADRHHVADVPIRHERRVHRALAHALELKDRLLVVLAEDLH